MTRLAAALALMLAVAVVPGSAQDRRQRLAPERIVLRTDLGDLVLALYPDVAPKTVAQLLKLARLGVYDTTHFYRVDPSFVLQLAVAQDRRTPLTPEQAAAIQRVPLELSDVRHRRGALSMARSERDPDGGETSFSILLVDAPHLDGKYVVFGHVEWGMDVADAMSRVERDEGHRPRERLEVSSAVVSTVEDLPKLGLRRPRPPVEGAAVASAAPAAAAPPDPVVVATLLVLGAVGVLAYVLGGRVSARTQGALGLLSVLVASFGLFVVLNPLARTRSWLAIAVFFGTLCVFRLMSQVEGSTPPPPSPRSKGPG